MPPPQLGTFSLSSSSAHAHSSRNSGYAGDSKSGAGYGGRSHGVSSEDAKRERKRREIVGKLGKEMSDRRDEFYSGILYQESVRSYMVSSMHLASKPDLVPVYNLRLYPISLERSALLGQNQGDERHALENAQIAYEEERKMVEDEWKKGRDRLRARMLEGIEERRRKAREEKDGEGTTADATLDLQSRPHATRKLRNKLPPGGAPLSPPTPLPSTLPPDSATTGIQLNGLLTSTTFTLSTNPLSLCIDELPSPFPLPLTSSSSSSMPSSSNPANADQAPTGGATANSRRRGGGNRNGGGGGGGAERVVGGLGKSLAGLAGAKEAEVESDLGDIRKSGKRRRAAATAAGSAIAGGGG